MACVDGRLHKSWIEFVGFQPRMNPWVGALSNTLSLSPCSLCVSLCLYVCAFSFFKVLFNYLKDKVRERESL